MAKAEPNVVPLCDVLLVLLIIFMVITPLVQKGIDVKLPETQSDTSAAGQPVGLLVLDVKAGDKVELNRIALDMRGLMDELRRQFASRVEKTIFIRALAKLPFSKIMEVIDICRGAGIDNIALIPEYVEE
jgi:biopolymer transport protein ExbD